MSVLVQVTTPQASIHDLVKWISFYRHKDKNIFLDVREQKTPHTGVIKHVLWRSLTDREEQELAKGLTEIQSNTLVLKCYNESVKKPKCGRSNKRGKK
jgi:hypothetical protein